MSNKKPWFIAIAVLIAMLTGLIKLNLSLRVLSKDVRSPGSSWEDKYPRPESFFSVTPVPDSGIEGFEKYNSDQYTVTISTSIAMIECSGDLYIEDTLEVDGHVTFSDDLVLKQGSKIYFGSGDDYFIGYNPVTDRVEIFNGR